MQQLHSVCLWFIFIQCISFRQRCSRVLFLCWILWSGEKVLSQPWAIFLWLNPQGVRPVPGSAKLPPPQVSPPSTSLERRADNDGKVSQECKKPKRLNHCWFGYNDLTVFDNVKCLDLVMESNLYSKLPGTYLPTSIYVFWTEFRAPLDS